MYLARLEREPPFDDGLDLPGFLRRRTPIGVSLFPDPEPVEEMVSSDDGGA